MPDINEILETMDYGVAPEATDQVSAWLAARKAELATASHFIGGAFVAGSGEETFEVLNPANGEVLVACSNGTAHDVGKAVAAARDAFPAWSRMPGHERARHLYAIARTLQKRERFLSVLESMDNGKPIRESRDIDVPLAIRHFYHHAGWAELVETEFPGSSPLGVCGQIIPWNFPLLMLAWKIAPALAAGNTVVLKPAEFTPLSAIAFAEICREVGLPAGVVNIVTGDGSTGAELVSHPDVDKVAFTGSTEVGRIIRRQTAGSGKKLSLELGGKSPFIVFDDADLDSAVEGVVDAIWFNQGQVCCAGSRLLVQQSVADAFFAKLRVRANNLRVGDPLDKSTDIGAVVDSAQLKRIAEFVSLGVREGAELWQPACGIPEHGFFFPPTLLTGVGPASTVMQEEIFGPVLVGMSFRTHDEAIALANNTRYGLSASVWSENLNVALDVAAKVKAGVIWINGTNMFDAAAGFGGYRQSGFGREGGREGMFEYLHPTRRNRARGGKEALASAAAAVDFSAAPGGGIPSDAAVPGLDRTAKLYIGGKQVRPDGGASYTVVNAEGKRVSQAGLGNRKDIRNAVEAAQKAGAWSATTGHARAQVLYFIAENLDVRRKEFAERIADLTGCDAGGAQREVEASVRSLTFYAAYADKYDGQIHSTRSRNVTLAMNEPWGVLGIACADHSPLAGFVGAVAPAIAMGNRTVVVPSQSAPLVASDLYQVFDTSDLPDGVVNIVSGQRAALACVLADHDDVDAFWTFGPADESADVERRSAGNLKPVWCAEVGAGEWLAGNPVPPREFLRRATQVKNIWVPYGE